jgi:hypothetical protein
MNVRGGYEGLEFTHTPADIDDPTAYEWQDIAPADFIVHAANMHLYRINSGQRLWSSTLSLASPKSSLSPDLK